MSSGETQPKPIMVAFDITNKSIGEISDFDSITSVGVEVIYPDLQPNHDMPDTRFQTTTYLRERDSTVKYVSTLRFDEPDSHQCYLQQVGEACSGPQENLDVTPSGITLNRRTGVTILGVHGFQVDAIGLPGYGITLAAIATEDFNDLPPAKKNELEERLGSTVGPRNSTYSMRSMVCGYSNWNSNISQHKLAQQRMMSNSETDVRWQPE